MTLIFSGSICTPSLSMMYPQKATRLWKNVEWRAPASAPALAPAAATAPEVARDQPHHTPATEQAPAEGRQREEQPGRPPPKKKNKKWRGEGEAARKQPTATKPPANNTEGGQITHPEGTEDRTPK